MITKSQGEGEKTVQIDQQAFAFADSLGAALASIDLYGIHHKLAVQALEKCYERLAAILSTGGRVDIARGDDGQLVLNRNPVAASNARLLAIARRLAALRMSGFVLRPGLDVDEFMKLIVYLSQPRYAEEGKDSSPRSLDEMGLPHVSSTRTVVTQVEDGKGTEDENAAGGAGKTNVDQILAFLRGEGVGDEAAARELIKAASDPEALADMIMQATSVRQAVRGLADGESLGELLIGCLRRTFETLVSDPAGKTLKGKKDIKRTLAVLEEKVLERLRKFAAEGFEDATEPVTDEFEGMKEEIEIDEVVSQYVKSRNLSAEKEKKLVRYMKRKGGDEVVAENLRERMEAEGLGADEWRQLVVRSGESAGKKGGDASGSAGSLPVLLAELTRVLDEKAPADKIEAVTGRVSQDMRAAIGRMADRIDDLAAAPRATPAQREALGGRALDLLRELVQELCQPISVINGAVQMLSDGRMGELSSAQKQLLDLVVESSARVHFLINRLVELAGVPRELSTNAAKLQAIYSGQRSEGSAEQPLSPRADKGKSVH